MKLLKPVALAIGCAGAIALNASPASAAIVCNEDEGICWHTETTYEYPAEARIVVHENDWRPHGRVEFREHTGRGYWHGGSWRTW